MVSGAEFQSYTNLRANPLDGTFLCDSDTGACYRTAGGAPLLMGAGRPEGPRLQPGDRRARAALGVLARDAPARARSRAPCSARGRHLVLRRGQWRSRRDQALDDARVSTRNGVRVSRTELAPAPAQPPPGRRHDAQGRADRQALRRAVGVARLVDATLEHRGHQGADHDRPERRRQRRQWRARGSTSRAPRPSRLDTPTPQFQLGSAATVVAGARRVERRDVVRRPATSARPTAAASSRGCSPLGVDRHHHDVGALSGPLRGWDYCFQVRARNRAGQVGPWSNTRCTSTPLDDTAATATSAGWLRSNSALLYAGTAMRTTTAWLWWKARRRLGRALGPRRHHVPDVRQGRRLDQPHASGRGRPVEPDGRLPAADLAARASRSPTAP